MDWESEEIGRLLDDALAEDIGKGDLTSSAIIADTVQANAVFVAKEDGILAGLPLVEKIFRKIDPECSVTTLLPEGSPLKTGDQICRVQGRALTLLSGERLSLNFMQRLSGIATVTSIYALAAAPAGIAVLDTRKTTPLLRSLEKYAVTVGGGKNNRFGLFDRVLVKDNHLRVQPDFAEILKAFSERNISAERVQIEVTSLEMLKQAMTAGASWFLLDNMTPAQIRRCVKIKRNNTVYEVSGGINAKNFANYLIPGIDGISIGALTHSVKSLDISLEFD